MNLSFTFYAEQTINLWDITHAIKSCSHHVSHSVHKLYILHLHCKSKSCCKEEEGPERTEAELYHQPGDDMKLFYCVHQVHYLNTAQ